MQKPDISHQFSFDIKDAMKDVTQSKKSQSPKAKNQSNQSNTNANTTPKRLNQSSQVVRDESVARDNNIACAEPDLRTPPTPKNVLQKPPCLKKTTIGSKSADSAANHSTQIELFSKILKSDPNNEEALLCRAQSLIAMNINDDGIDDLVKARELFIQSKQKFNLSLKGSCDNDNNDFVYQKILDVTQKITSIEKELKSLICDKLHKNIMVCWDKGDIMGLLNEFQNIYDKYPFEIFYDWVCKMEKQYRIDWKNGIFDSLNPKSNLSQISNKCFDYHMNTVKPSLSYLCTFEHVCKNILNQNTTQIETLVLIGTKEEIDRCIMYFNGMNFVSEMNITSPLLENQRLSENKLYYKTKSQFQSNYNKIKSPDRFTRKSRLNSGDLKEHNKRHICDIFTNLKQIICLISDETATTVETEGSSEPAPAETTCFFPSPSQKNNQFYTPAAAQSASIFEQRRKSSVYQAGSVTPRDLSNITCSPIRRTPSRHGKRSSVSSKRSPQTPSTSSSLWKNDDCPRRRSVVNSGWYDENIHSCGSPLVGIKSLVATSPENVRAQNGSGGGDHSTRDNENSTCMEELEQEEVSVYYINGKLENRDVYRKVSNILKSSGAQTKSLSGEVKLLCAMLNVDFSCDHDRDHDTSFDDWYFTLQKLGQLDWLSFITCKHSLFSYTSPKLSHMIDHEFILKSCNLKCVEETRLNQYFYANQWDSIWNASFIVFQGFLSRVKFVRLRSDDTGMLFQKECQHTKMLLQTRGITIR